MTLLAAVQILKPSATQEQVDFYLNPIIDKAQACLDNYSEDEQNQALAYLFAHLTTQSSGGQITSERTRTGAQRAYAQTVGSGLMSTQFGQWLLNMSGAAQCLVGVVESKRFAVSVNPKRGRR